MIYTLASFDLEMLIFGGLFSYEQVTLYLFSGNSKESYLTIFLCFRVSKADKMKRGSVSIIN